MTAQEALQKLQDADFPARLWRKDASLWKTDDSHRKIISNSLGWLSAPDSMAAGLGSIRGFVSEIRTEGFNDAVVLGMGGSSLACEVFAGVFRPRKGFPRLSILDTTHPGAVQRIVGGLDLQRTLFIVSSKSGSTIEPNSLLSYLFAQSDSADGKASRRFIAVTDPGTSMERQARQLRFRKVFLNPSDIGGRYSALTYFGLVPAALMGVEIDTLLNHARRTAQKMRTQPRHEAYRLGALLGAAAAVGRDKLSLCLDPGWESLGLWIEQLVAESTGKELKGILPAIEKPAAGLQGQDRVYVRLKTGGKAPAGMETALKSLKTIGHPVMRLSLKDPLELGSQFLTWEVATAAAGFLMGVNPFDQPDVESAKRQTRELLTGLNKGRLPEEKAPLYAGSLPAFADTELLDLLNGSGAQSSIREVLTTHFHRLKPGDYCAILAYLDPDGPCRAPLLDLFRKLRESTLVPVTLSFGPRYLHSTGQLYKGGSRKGLFLELTESDTAAIAIPGQPYNFGVLHRAQARGDFAAMISAGRRVLRIDLGARGGDNLRALVNALSS